MPFYAPRPERKEQDHLKRLERLGALLADHGLDTLVIRRVSLRLFQNELAPATWREPVLSVRRPGLDPTAHLEITVRSGKPAFSVTLAGGKACWTYRGDEDAVISFVLTLLDTWPETPDPIAPPETDPTCHTVPPPRPAT
jgi:hypothetical protein